MKNPFENREIFGFHINIKETELLLKIISSSNPNKDEENITIVLYDKFREILHQLKHAPD